MRCLVCNAEMILMKVDQDDTMPVPGFDERNRSRPAVRPKGRSA
jgi:hypothetical protein